MWELGDTYYQSTSFKYKILQNVYTVTKTQIYIHLWIYIYYIYISGKDTHTYEVESLLWIKGQHNIYYLFI